MSFDVVVEINNASVERNYVYYLIDQNFERVLDVERCAESAGNFIKRINLTVGILDLIVSHVCTALPRLGEIDFAWLNQLPGRVCCRLLLQTTLGDLLIKPGQMLDEKIDYVRIKMNAATSHQQSGGLV